MRFGSLKPLFILNAALLGGGILASRSGGISA